MKKLILLSTAIFLFGCTKSESDLVFDKLPEQRVEERNAELRAALVEAENGWNAVLTTGNDLEFSFYLDFTKDENVKMVSDINEKTIITPASSTWRIKYVMNTSLIFDTYNYITQLQDPTPSVLGGVAGNGFFSDIEFEYLRSTPDSVILKGKKYHGSLILTKAKVEEKKLYLEGKFYDMALKTDAAIAEFDNIILEKSASERLQIDVNSNKTISISSVEADGSILTADTYYHYTLTGIAFLNPLIYKDLKLVALNLKANGNLVALDSQGKEHVLKNSASPILPLYKLMGVKYNRLFSPFKTIFPGTTTKGAEIMNFYHQNLNNAYTGYTFGNGSLSLSWNLVNQRVSVIGWHNQNGNTGWNTTAVFGYTVDDAGVYTFTLLTPAAGGYVQKLISEPGKPTIQNFLLTNKIKLDYFIDGNNVYGMMESINDPTIKITFQLN